MPKTQVVRWGNSLAVRIPKGIAEEAFLKEGDAVVLKATRGKVELRRETRVPTLEELVAKITPENRHGERDWGTAVGREAVEW